MPTGVPYCSKSFAKNKKIRAPRKHCFLFQENIVGPRKYLNLFPEHRNLARIADFRSRPKSIAKRIPRGLCSVEQHGFGPADPRSVMSDHTTELPTGWQAIGDV